MGRYDAMTQEQHDVILAEVMDANTASALLDVPGVYEAVSEHYNNEVLERWDQEHAAEHECDECGTWVDAPLHYRNEKPLCESCHEAEG